MVKKTGIICLATLSIGLLGWLITQNLLPKRIINDNLNGPYQSVACIQTGNMVSSGVMLKSGYLLTASHCIDRNCNGIIDDYEKFIIAEFVTDNGMAFTTTATAIAISGAADFDDLDIAILTLEDRPPITGADLLTIKEYDLLTIGTSNLILGMACGEKPANITQGYITSKNNEYNHRSSATVYMGNSGGGVFTCDKKLIGITSKVGIDAASLIIPIFDNGKLSGQMRITYPRYLANISFYVPVPAIRTFIEEEGLTDQVFPPLRKTPKYFHFTIFNTINLLILSMVFKITNQVEILK
jgi:V8-like Glu-specific endopeptidase